MSEDNTRLLLTLVVIYPIIFMVVEAILNLLAFGLGIVEWAFIQLMRGPDSGAIAMAVSLSVGGNVMLFILSFGYPSPMLIIFNVYNIGVVGVIFGTYTYTEYLAGQDDGEPFSLDDLKDIKTWITVLGVVIAANYMMAVVFGGLGMVLSFLFQYELWFAALVVAPALVVVLAPLGIYMEYRGMMS